MVKKQFIRGILSLHVSIVFVSFAAIFSKAIVQPVTLIIAGRVLTGFLILSLVRVFFVQKTVLVSRRDVFCIDDFFFCAQGLNSGCGSCPCGIPPCS